MLRVMAMVSVVYVLHWSDGLRNLAMGLNFMGPVFPENIPVGALVSDISDNNGFFAKYTRFM
jgi:hypothetical protein